MGNYQQNVMEFCEQQLHDFPVQNQNESNIGSKKYEPIEKRRMLQNVIVISIAFMVLFTATGSMSNLQSSLNPESGLGTYSRAFGYGAMIFASIFLPKFIMERYTVKWALTITMFGSIFSICAQFYPRFITMIPASIMSGVFSATFWSAKCTYLTHIGQEYAELVGQNSDIVITYFFGIFFFIFQSSKVWGNLIASTILSTEYENGTSWKYKDISVCGNSFCPLNAQDSSVIVKPPIWQVYTLSGVYLCVAFTSVVIAVLFIDPLVRYGEKKKDNKATWRSQLQSLNATFQHMFNPLQIILIPMTVWSGLEQGFYSADFNQAYVTCAWGIKNLGYVGICYGFCDAIAAYSFGVVTRYSGRIPVFLLGTLMSYGIVITLFNWQPDPEKPWTFFVIAGVWGVVDGIWQTQINAFYGIIFPNDKEAAFSNYRLWESLGFIVAFVNADIFCIDTKLHLLLFVLNMGMVGYFIIEFLIRRRRNGYEQA